MTERPITLRAPEVRAILEGRKSMTRRVLKPQPERIIDWASKGRDGWRFPGVTIADGYPFQERDLQHARLPYAPGDLLWVRETWNMWHQSEDEGPERCVVEYRAGPDHDIKQMVPSRYGEEFAPYNDAHFDAAKALAERWRETWTEVEGWRSPIHMPRWASRITLRVTEVRVQRLQDISAEDARAEGATMRPNCSGFQSRYDGWSMDWSPVGTPSRWAKNGTLTERDISLGAPRWAFASYWNDLHKPGARWEDNPWVAAISFEVVR